MGLSLNLPPCIFLSTNKSSQTIVSPSLFSIRGRTHAAADSREKLLKSPVVQVKNKMAQMGVYFYEIALEDVEFANVIARTSC